MVLSVFRYICVSCQFCVTFKNISVSFMSHICFWKFNYLLIFTSTGHQNVWQLPTPNAPYVNTKNCKNPIVDIWISVDGNFSGSPSFESAIVFSPGVWIYWHPLSLKNFSTTTNCKEITFFCFMKGWGWNIKETPLKSTQWIWGTVDPIIY